MHAQTQQAIPSANVCKLIHFRRLLCRRVSFEVWCALIDLYGVEGYAIAVVSAPLWLYLVISFYCLDNPISH